MTTRRERRQIDTITACRITGITSTVIAVLCTVAAFAMSSTIMLIPALFNSFAAVMNAIAVANGTRPERKEHQ